MQATPPPESNVGGGCGQFGFLSTIPLQLWIVGGSGGTSRSLGRINSFYSWNASVLDQTFLKVFLISFGMGDGSASTASQKCGLINSLTSTVHMVFPLSIWLQFWEWIRIQSFWIQYTSSERPRRLLHSISDGAKEILLNISVLLAIEIGSMWRCANKTCRASRASVEPSIEPPTKHVEPVEPLDSKECLIVFFCAIANGIEQPPGVFLNLCIEFKSFEF